MNQKEHDLKFLNLKLLAWKGQVRSNVSESFNLSLVESSVIDAMELCGAHSRIQALRVHPSVSPGSVTELETSSLHLQTF